MFRENGQIFTKAILNMTNYNDILASWNKILFKIY